VPGERRRWRGAAATRRRAQEPGSSGTPTRSSTTTPGSRPAPYRFVFSPRSAVFRRLGVANGRGLGSVVSRISSDRGSWALLVVLTVRADIAYAVMRIHDHFCRNQVETRGEHVKGSNEFLVYLLCFVCNSWLIPLAWLRLNIFLCAMRFGGVSPADGCQHMLLPQTRIGLLCQKVLYGSNMLSGEILEI
jgi:hypothetical protein